MKYPCLVVDHDDTVVNSTATVHYPSFCEFMAIHYPQMHYTLEDYFLKNFSPGTLELFRDEIGMDEDMMREEHRFWDDYVQGHVPQVYDGMREILWAHKNAGGLLCVVSHSLSKNILRDYRENGLPEPDLMFGWEIPVEQRKPNTYPLEKIMETFGLGREDLLMLDDLKPGYDMARAVGVRFAAAGWANDIPQIERFMRSNCDLYFKTVAEFGAFLAEA